MRLIAATAFILIPVLTAPSLADWQYTRWGMTADEVRTASGGTAATPPKPGHGWEDETTEGLLSAPYQAGRFSFTAEFLFSKTDHKLASVELQFLQEDASKLPRKERWAREADLTADRRELVNTMIQKYGKPERDQILVSGLVHRLDWRTDEDAVSLLEIGSHAILIIYKPLKSKESDAL
jgi:hypothetical protein